MDADPIFIHAWWRSGSTYVWSKLRENESLVCYYEPLHERNAHLTVEKVEEPADEKISRELRHPMQTKNYFSEYAALIRSNDLQFSPTLPYDRFLLRPDEADDALKIYIDGLLRVASDANRIPVLCFVRSQMRSAWIKKAFGGVHIAQIRNPLDQWASFRVEPYFRDKMLIIALNLRKLHPAAFAHIEAFERFARYMSKHPASVVERLFDTFVAEKDALAVFLIIWLASALQAICVADFILDIDWLSSDLESRKTAERWFATIGCPVDFSDCASPSWDELPVSRSEFEHLVEDATTAIRSKAAPLVIATPDAIRGRLALLSPLSGKVLRMALEE
jgi:hypothetical protein